MSMESVNVYGVDLTLFGAWTPPEVEVESARYPNGDPAVYLEADELRELAAEIERFADKIEEHNNE